jgi:hypothetical protein
MLGANAMMKRASVALLVGFGAVLLGAYVVAYALLVQRIAPGSEVVSSPLDRVWCRVHYRVGDDVGQALFAPIHRLDRRVRKEFWSPTAADALRQFK